jgi:DHA1 family tetracycline resistance protein-like MFS transporter
LASIERQSQIFPILLVNFIGTLGFSIVLPFLVFLVRDFGGNAIAYGILGATYSAFQLIGAPILGKWSDTYGRKKILLLSNAGTLIGWIFFLFALFLPVEKFTFDNALVGTFIISLPLLVLFLARAIDGITGGNISVANAYLADISSNENRSRNFGKMAVSQNLGFIVGPALAGILGGTIYGAILPVSAALILSLVTIIVISFRLKESKLGPPKILVQEEGTIRKVFSQECKDCFDNENPKKLKFRDVFKLKHIPYLLVLYFLIFLGFNIYYASFPIHAAIGLKWSVTQLGIFYAVLSGIMVVIQGPVLRKALKKSSEQKLVIIGSAILGTNFILFMSNNTFVIYGAVILFALGNGLMWPSFMSILSKRAGTALQGAVQGVAGSFGSLASIIGLILGGTLYNLTGPATFLVSAGVIFTVFIMSFPLLKDRNSDPAYEAK